jgi:para-aminobenzoate synthetase
VNLDPVERFVELASTYDRMFWLDGGGAREWSGRRSILGFLRDEDVSLTYDAVGRRVLRHCDGSSDVVGDDPFVVLADELARDGGDPSVSWVGYFGYASRSDLPAAAGTGGLPDAVWMRVRDPMFVTHDAAAEPAGDRRRLGVGPVPRHYRDGFAEVQRQLRLGNSYEVNLTYREELQSEADPVATYLALRSSNPAPYAGYLQHHGVHLLSSSPERFATVDRDRWVETKPIKGTTPRGADEVEDARRRRTLAEDTKYRAENLMIVDLLRNDLSMVCEPGTVDVPTLMEVESYPSVHQLVSTVRGRLRDDVGTVEALHALFPAGSMTGAPKLRTMQVIESVETSPRGVYAGAFGWIGTDGRADLGVVIRSLVARRAETGWCYTVGTGGGITVRSDLHDEWAETRWKAERLLAAVRRSDPAVPRLVDRLRAAGCVFAEEEADVLVSTARSPEELDAMTTRRVAGEPLEHVVGWADFCGLRLVVEPGVFVPRHRSELLVSQAVRLLDGLPHPLVVDLCCGTGALGAAVAAARRGVRLHASDVDPAAVRCARRNLSDWGGAVHEGDLFDALPRALRGRVDVLLANVPYVPTDAVSLMPPEARLHEDRRTLDGGADGLHVLRRLAAGVTDWLAPGGHVLVEAADEQAPVAVEVLASSGLAARTVRSTDGDTTVVVGTRGDGSGSQDAGW